jgi:2-C-methyl-D-erythritol 2,4-cyclodiphosphate synthase
MRPGERASSAPLLTRCVSVAQHGIRAGPGASPYEALPHSAITATFPTGPRLPTAKCAWLDMRIGIGYDVHRLGAARPLRLGGVVVDAERGLEGHSDADVLTHAIIDALLGAAALGDIGSHFPPHDPTYAEADSLALLSHVITLVRDAGYAVQNIDATVIAEAPVLRPYIDAIRTKLAETMDIDVGDVSVKAKTNEGLDAVGARAAIAAQAITLIAPQSKD